MKTVTLSILSVALVSGAIIQSSQAIIRGKDTRIEAFQIDAANLQNPTVDPEILRSISDASVAIFNKSEISVKRKALKLKKGQTLGQYWNVCSTERFTQQPRNAFCSGTLIAPDLILTAGHCVSEEGNSDPTWCRNNVKFVFGYEMSDANSVASMATSEMYGCSDIVAMKIDIQSRTNYVDIALVKLDRPVSNHAPVAIDRSGLPIDLQTELTMSGYPAGIPKKIDLGGSVKASDPTKSFFTANLNSMGGNSGSPVFNSKTGEVVGVLGGKVIITHEKILPGQGIDRFGRMVIPKTSGGDIDFVISENPGQSCNVENVKTIAETLGDLVTRISEIAPSIPAQ